MKPDEIEKEANKYFMPILAIQVSEENLQIIKSMMEAQAIVSFKAGYQDHQEELSSKTDEEMLLTDKEIETAIEAIAGYKVLETIRQALKSQLAKLAPIFNAQKEKVLAEKDEEIIEWRTRCHDGELGNSVRDKIQEGHEADKQQAVSDAYHKGYQDGALRITEAKGDKLNGIN
jgi:hypothetical protein